MHGTNHSLHPLILHTLPLGILPLSSAYFSVPVLISVASLRNSLLLQATSETSGPAKSAAQQDFKGGLWHFYEGRAEDDAIKPGDTVMDVRLES